ncbi:MAG TPA: DUF2569 domain-containing protein [Pseudolabrys sp.]
MTEAAAVPQPESIPVGIKGWLILPAIGTILSPIYLSIAVFKMVPSLEKIWAAKDSLSTSLLAFVAVETIVNITFIVGWLVAILLLTLRSWYYPRAYIILMCGMVGFLLLDMIVSAGGFNHQPEQDDLVSLGRTIVVAAIWVPYMFLSKRVKNTFVWRPAA